MEYISKFKGSEIDTELTYVKNTVRQKLPDVEMQLTELSSEMQRMYEELKAMIQGGATTPPYAVLDNAILDQVILS